MLRALPLAARTGGSSTVLDLITMALKIALFDWSRKSELTADRAGLLVSQDPQVAVRTMLKLAGGSVGARDSLNVEQFLQQADDYEEMGNNLLDAIYMMEMTIYQTHPFPALRAREMDRWSRSDQYRAILTGDYPRTESAEQEERRCAKCAAPVSNPVFRFCPECGESL